MSASRRIIQLLASLVMLASLALSPQGVARAGPATLYVSTTGSDDANDCKTSTTPCQTIQHAIDQALGGDVIKVAVGTYTGSGTATIVTLRRSVFLSGGWASDFASQPGFSVIDGEKARGGIYLYDANVIVQIERFAIVHSPQAGISIQAAASVTLENVTIGENTSTSGVGGMSQSSGSLTIRNSTIAHNTGSSVGGLAVSSYGSPSVTILNTILADNFATGSTHKDCQATIQSSDHNIIGDIAGCTVIPGPDDQLGVDPHISPYLVANGYFTLASDSPAIDHADPVDFPAVDQRGMPRPQVGGPDIGAYEYIASPGTPAAAGIVVGPDQLATPGTRFALPLGLYVVDALGSAVSGVAVTFTAPASGPSGTFEGGTNVADVSSDTSGLAVTPTFTANGEGGQYNVNAAVEGLGGSFDIALANAVWYVTTAGDDSSSCLSPAEPCRTIDGAIAKAAPGETVRLAAGVYTMGDLPHQVYDFVADIEKNLTISGGWDAAFAAQTGSSVIDGENARGGVRIPWGSNVILENLTIRNGAPQYWNGGGIYVHGSLTLRNSTVIGNATTGNGGGIYVGSGSALTVQNSTIAHNRAAQGGGIYDDSATLIVLQNTILATNTSTAGGPDCYGTLDSADHSLIGKTASCSVTAGADNLLDVDPLFGPHGMVPYGELPLLNGSPAIDAGDNGSCTLLDARGLGRPVDGNSDGTAACDIGSYEYAAPGPAAALYKTIGDNQHAGPQAAFIYPLVVTVVDSLGGPVAGAEVTFDAPDSGPSGTFAASGSDVTYATSDVSGRAIASAFTANGELGSFNVTATAAGAGSPVDFGLTIAAWFVSPTGNNANSCASPAAPCLTINAAIDKAQAGDAIDVAVGTYTAASGKQVVLVDKSLTLSGGWDDTFTSRIGRSTINGQNARHGLVVNASTVVAVEHFVIRDSHFPPGGDGGGVINDGTLTLTDCIITNNRAQTNGGGILTGYETKLTLNETTVGGNTAGTPWLGGAGGGAGISAWTATVVLNNSTISGNQLIDYPSWHGSAIYKSQGTLVLNNSTVSGNTGAPAIENHTGSVTLNNSTVSGNSSPSEGAAIHLEGGTLTLNNSTITRNTSKWGPGGIDNELSSFPSSVHLRNSIVAGNTGNAGPGDCRGKIRSGGYNLLGTDFDCDFEPGINDLVGTENTPIDPRLLPLRANGGPTKTHALATDSPALDAGNPGPSGKLCLGTDQRGVARPQGARCDIGAFEGHYPAVKSVSRASANPTRSPSVDFKVAFSEKVTGIDLGDFGLKMPGVSGAAISALSGSGANYTVTVDTGSGNGSIRLDVIDDGTVFDATGNPLGGPASADGNFTTGQSYTVHKLAAPLAPPALSWDRTPTYKWNSVPGATKYGYEVLKDEATVYTKIVSPAGCTSACTNTPTTVLAPAEYEWRARPFVAAAWQPWSSFSLFKIFGPKIGLWKGSPTEFYVLPDGLTVSPFSVYIHVYSCGYYKVSYGAPVPIRGGKFTFAGPLRGDGVFSSANANSDSAQGSFSFGSLFIPGCGSISGGPFSWNAHWQSGDLPSKLPSGSDPILVLPQPKTDDAVSLGRAEPR